MSVFRTDALAGRAAFIAGGTSGINLGIAECFARAGANVAVFSRNPEKVGRAAEQIKAAAPAASVLGLCGDVRDYGSVEAAVLQAKDAFGLLDIVVSGAAGNFVAPAESLSANAFRTVVDIDLNGTFNVLRAAFEVARKPGASFINISAPQAATPFWGQAHVCAAKAGVEMLTRALAFEWGAFGIRVNAVVPGPIAGTEGMARLAATPELHAAVTKSVPMRRFGTVPEVADTALFLASGAAEYVNGGIFYCDGGQTLSGGLATHPQFFTKTMGGAG